MALFIHFSGLRSKCLTMDGLPQSFAEESFYASRCHNKLIFCFRLSMSSLRLHFCKNPLEVFSITKVILVLILFVIMERACSHFFFCPPQHLISLSWLVMMLWKPGCNLSSLLTHSFYIVVLFAFCCLIKFLLLKGTMCLAAACLDENTTMSHLFWGVKSECMEQCGAFPTWWKRTSHLIHADQDSLVINGFFFFFPSLTWFLEASHSIGKGIKGKKKLNVSDHYRLFLEKKKWGLSENAGLSTCFS